MNPLYQQVSEKILGRIRSGELKVGDRLPPEASLAEELGVSRSTVRLAFTELENSGVLLRRKRLGTKVIADEPQRRFNMATQGVDELLSLGRDTRFDIRSIGTVRTADIPQLEGHNSETGFWLEVCGSRTLVGETQPFSVNHVYVPARYAGIEPLLSSGASSVFQIIESTFAITVGRVAQTAKAVACPSSEAQTMGVETGAPVLLIEAVLHSQNDCLMEVSVAYFDPDRFQLNTDVRIV